MATKIIGKDSKITFDSTDVSVQYTSFEWTTTAPEAPQIDVSDKSSTEQETIDGLSGAPKTTFSLECNDVVGGLTALSGIAVNDSGDLVYMPEGETAGKPEYTLASAIISSIGQSGGFQGKVVWKLSGYANAEMAVDTVSA